MTFIIFQLLTVLMMYISGRCPISVTHSAMTTCDGSFKAGSEVYIDFHKINSPCTCTVIPSVSGNLFIRAEEVTVNTCTTVIEVGNSRYTCPTERTLISFNVIANQSVTLTARYKPAYNSGLFYHCLGFHQSSYDVQVICGSGSTTQTTTSEKTTVYIPSTQISSAEMTVSSTHQDDSTATSNDLRIICTEPAGNELTQMDEVSNIHLQIPLVLFVVIAVVSVIFNIYLFNKLRQRNDSKSQQEQDTSRRVKHRVSNQSATGAYTELDVANITAGATGGGNQTYTELDLRNNTTGTTGGGNQTYMQLNIASVTRGTPREGNQYNPLSPLNDYINVNAS